MMPKLAEVFFSQPEERGTVKLRISTDVVVRMRMEIFSIAILPHFFGSVLPFQIDDSRTPVVLFARHVVPSFEQKNLLPGGRQLGGERSAPGASPDDDDVVMVIGHGFIGHGGLRI